MLEQLLARLGENASQLKAEDLTLFAGRAGSKQASELMVVGRAVNGGDLCFRADRLETAEERSGFLDRLYADTVPAEGDPMAWVGRLWGRRQDIETASPPRAESRRLYSSGRSQFWRVVRRVALAVVQNATESDWFTRIAWSNLYKVSPHRTGNPSKALITIQHGDCCKVLSSEFDLWKPRRILFLTGAHWASSFLNYLGWSVAPTPNSEVYSSCLPHGPVVVVAPHPQGKKEGELAELVVKEFLLPTGLGD